MDVTVTPYYYTNQGFRGDFEFRHRLDNGFYTLNLIGVHEDNPDVYGVGSRVNRGMIVSQGAIWLNQNWKFGWDVVRATDKYFNNDYQVGNNTLNGNFFRENSSTAYITGQGDRGYFDLRGYSFQGLANTDLQPQLAAVWPILDYNKMISLDPANTWGIGGEIEIDVNFTRSSAGLASYQQIGSYQFDVQYGMYAVCRNPSTMTALYTKQNCLLRGIGGEYDSGTLQVSWKRKYIDPLGEVWTPFTFARANLNYLNANVNGAAVFSRILCRSGDRDGLYDDHGPDRQHLPDEFRQPQRPVRRLCHAGRRPGMALSAAVEDPHWRDGDRADRADHRAAQRPADQQHGQPRRAEPGVRRHQPVRVEQIFGLRPLRDRRARQLRRPVHLRHA